MAGQIPFRIDRNRPQSLVKQMTDGLRDAIDTGYYKPGDTLPTIHEWTRMFDVSIRVPEGALANLVKERYVVTRPRQGCIVLPRRRSVWRGRVLMVRFIGSYSRFIGEQLAAMEEQLVGADYLVTTALVRERGSTLDLAPLDAELRRNTSFVVVLGDQQPILRRVAKSGLPYIDFCADATAETPRMCVGHVAPSAGRAKAQLVEHCVGAGVKSVLVVGKARSVDPVVAMLEGAGIVVEQLAVDAEFGMDRAENLERETSMAIDGLFANRGRNWLPDLIYCVDDYQATGALFSLLGHGVRIPEDVWFVTVKHRGNGPVMSKSVACIQYDTVTTGRAMGLAAVRYLKEGKFVFDADAIAPQYIKGDTFR